MNSITSRGNRASLTSVECLENAILIMDMGKKEKSIAPGLFEDGLKEFNLALLKVSEDEALSVLNDYLKLKELDSSVKAILVKARARLDG